MYHYGNEKSINSLKINAQIIPYEKELFHFGIEDGGEGLLAIFGAFNLENNNIRVDLFDIYDSFKHTSSYKIPYNVHFSSNLAPNYKYLNILNFRKGFLCFNNNELYPEVMYFNKKKRSSANK
jgi:hypothetical protein